jgi:hypothetical protein
MRDLRFSQTLLDMEIKTARSSETLVSCCITTQKIMNYMRDCYFAQYYEKKETVQEQKWTKNAIIFIHFFLQTIFYKSLFSCKGMTLKYNQTLHSITYAGFQKLKMKIMALYTMKRDIIIDESLLLHRMQYIPPK